MSDRTDRTDCPAFELLAVAYHESGHGVGAVLVNPGLAIETVTIKPDEDYLGRYTFEDWHENLVPVLEGVPAEVVLVGLEGHGLDCQPGIDEHGADPVAALMVGDRQEFERRTAGSVSPVAHPASAFLSPASIYSAASSCMPG